MIDGGGEVPAGEPPPAKLKRRGVGVRGGCSELATQLQMARKNVAAAESDSNWAESANAGASELVRAVGVVPCWATPSWSFAGGPAGSSRRRLVEASDWAPVALVVGAASAKNFALWVDDVGGRRGRAVV